MEALEQAVRLQENMGMMGVRLQALRDQKDIARRDELFKSLEEEEASLRRTIDIVEKQVGAMHRFFQTTVIEINGNSMPAMQAFEALRMLIGQRNSLERVTKGLNLKDCGSPKLKLAAEQMLNGMVGALEAWQEEIFGYLVLLHGIHIPAEAKDMFESVWVQKNVHMELRWNAEEQAFELPVANVDLAADVQAFMAQAKETFINSRAPNGTVFVVQATQGAKGRKFSGKVRMDHPFGVANDTTGDYSG